MVMRRHVRHVGLPPPCYLADGSEGRDEGGAGNVDGGGGNAGVEGGAGDEGGTEDNVGAEVGAGGNTGAEGDVEGDDISGDELIDSDYEMGEGNNVETLPTETELRENVEGPTNPTILPPMNEGLNQEDGLDDAVITQD
ncbi:hypothetical protein Salat_0188600 [Sesamum alatum]|uniref:Uncharacterized protein n=1 Tax=Sesamum alatum TaxID=300844 RepID=A0AAE2CXU0_9LAMI|nr:hypothetical protein Salat_0188600 [Sesamum alatum]